MISTKRLNIVEATADEVELIIAIESHEDNRDFLWIGTVEEHLAEIQDENHYLWLFKSNVNDQIIGYALARIDKKSNVFELRRIAIVDKGLGYGKEAVSAIIAYSFEVLNMNRFWLDVYPDNYVGIKLYESLGLCKEGILRQNYKSSRGYLDQIIYSMLKEDYIISPN